MFKSRIYQESSGSQSQNIPEKQQDSHKTSLTEIVAHLSHLELALT
jgi:hypothetical protein